jgi:hypothetical protein
MLESRIYPVHRWRYAVLVTTLTMMAAVGCANPAQPDPAPHEFVVEVTGERFVVRLTDADTIERARENLRGQNRMFPAGPLRRGNGGFNAPWTWHLDPAETRFVEAAIEVCDGRPSYVEGHQPEYATYCPWGAKVVAER